MHILECAIGANKKSQTQEKFEWQAKLVHRFSHIKDFYNFIIW